MKHFILWTMSAAALLLAGCARENYIEGSETPAQSETVWTVSVEATKAQQTKALDNEDEDTINFYWAGTDQVEVHDAFGSCRGSLVPDQLNGNTTILRGTLNGGFNVGQTYTLYFLKKPAAENAYAAQKGTVEDIAKNFDYATAAVKVTKVDNSANKVYFSPATFECLQSITKFIFSYRSGAPGDIKKLTITASGRMDPVTVIPDNPAMEFHVALPRVDSGGEKIVYTFLAETGNGDIYEGTRKAALQAGKYYRGTVRLEKYDPIATPLTIEALEDGVITISNPLGKKIWYNDQGGDLSQPTTSTDDPIEIPVSAGQRVVLGGNNVAYAKIENDKFIYTKIRCSARHYLYGNVMSLRDVLSYANPNLHSHMREVGNYAFSWLFYENRQLYNHPVKTIELPATKVGNGAYHSMFSGCSSLEVAPELPATSFPEIEDGETAWYTAPYGNMFEFCRSLKKAPTRLPAKTTGWCYRGMFYSCVSLAASPVLEDETPSRGAYVQMFYGCSALQQITCYSRNNLWSYTDTVWTASGYVGYEIINHGAPHEWVRGVSPTGVFYKHPKASWPVGDSGIPSGWTYDRDPLIIEAIEDGTLSINNPRGLSFTYGKEVSMNEGTTTSLPSVSIPVSAGDKVRLWGDNAVYSGYVDGTYYEDKNFTITGDVPHYVYGDIRSLVSSGNFPNVNELSAYAFAGLFRGNTRLRSHDHLDLTIGADRVGASAFKDMFKGCTAFKRAPELPATKLAAECYAGMFNGCTDLRTAPALPATKLESHCYSAMFQGCSKLDVPPSLPATTLAEGCYMNMFENCVLLTDAPELKAGTLVNGCYSYMFRGCTRLKTLTCLATNPTLSNYNVAPPVMGGNVDGWLADTNSTGTLTIKSGVTWPGGSIPTGWNITRQ